MASEPARAAGEPVTTGIKPTNVFLATNIWTVHLTVAPEQWQAMEPKQGSRPARKSIGET